MAGFGLVIATSRVRGPDELDVYRRRHRQVPAEVIADAQRAGVQAACVAHHGTDLYLAMVVSGDFTFTSLASTSVDSITAAWNADMAALLRPCGENGVPWREAGLIQQWSAL